MDEKKYTLEDLKNIAYLIIKFMFASNGEEEEQIENYIRDIIKSDKANDFIEHIEMTFRESCNNKIVEKKKIKKL